MTRRLPSRPRRRFPIKRVLLTYKKSVYEIYVVQRLQKLGEKSLRLNEKLFRNFEMSHLAHYRMLKQAQDALKEEGLYFATADRKRAISYKDYDLIITIGGDGTLLSASAKTDRQLLLAVNSNPDVSVGRFCSANPKNFRAVLKRVIAGNAVVRELNCMDIFLNGKRVAAKCLNDVLVCHKNPPAMSHYTISVGERSEYQRSSGIWISTAAGSTGAIQSAGAKPLPLLSKKLLYRPRELYWYKRRRYRLTGGILDGEQGLQVDSMMEDGMIYLDGFRQSFPFCHGDRLVVKRSAVPLYLVDYQSHLHASHLKR